MAARGRRRRAAPEPKPARAALTGGRPGGPPRRDAQPHTPRPTSPPGPATPEPPDRGGPEGSRARPKAAPESRGRASRHPIVEAGLVGVVRPGQERVGDGPVLW